MVQPEDTAHLHHIIDAVMSALGSPSSSTSGSYIIAEEAGIGVDGEIVTGPSTKEAKQSSDPQAVPASFKPSHQSDGSCQQQQTGARNDGNIIMREPGNEDEHVQGKPVIGESAEPSSAGFHDYDEALDYMDEDSGHGNPGSSSQVVPPPLAYLQQATGTQKCYPRSS